MDESGEEMEGRWWEMVGRERMFHVFGDEVVGEKEKEKEREWFDDLMGSVMDQGKGKGISIGKEQRDHSESLQEDFDKEPFPKLQEQEEFPKLPEQEQPAEVHVPQPLPVTTRRRGRSVMVLPPPTAGGGVMVLPAPSDEQPNPQLQPREQELPIFRPGTPAPRSSTVLPRPATFQQPSQQQGLPPFRAGTPAPRSRTVLPPPAILQQSAQSQRQIPSSPTLPTRRTRGRSQSIMLPPPPPGVAVLDWQAQFQLPAMQSQPQPSTSTTTTTMSSTITITTTPNATSSFPNHSRPRAASVMPTTTTTTTTKRYDPQAVSLALLPQASVGTEHWAMKEARRNNLAARLDALQRRARARGTSAWQRGHDVQDYKTGNPVKMILDRMPVGFYIAGPRQGRKDPAW
ncbi:hypothetical protein GE09DRAFT_1213418 [Coniochaeta sp. 2T2.1]|nr:hypothetical protein GE09DRAFT_1213418 [Coniochaeta sp. 2T2.1]